MTRPQPTRLALSSSFSPGSSLAPPFFPPPAMINTHQPPRLLLRGGREGIIGQQSTAATKEREKRETTLVVYASLSTFADCEERERKRERERNELINSGERGAAAAFLFPSPPPFCVTLREGGGDFPISGEGALLSLQLIAISPRNSFQRKVEGEGESLPSRGKRSNSLSSSTATKGLHMRWWQSKFVFIESAVEIVSFSAIVSVHW